MYVSMDGYGQNCINLCMHVDTFIYIHAYRINSRQYVF